jgi:hypothetical protein
MTVILSRCEHCPHDEANTNDYIHLLRRGRIAPEDTQFYLRQIQYSEPNNQYCIATEKGISMLIFKESYEG